MGIFPQLQTLKVEFPYEAWNKRQDYSLQPAPTRCLLDCFYCDGDDDIEKLQALVDESRPLILAAFRDTDVAVTVECTDPDPTVHSIFP